MIAVEPVAKRGVDTPRQIKFLGGPWAGQTLTIDGDVYPVAIEAVRAPDDCVIDLTGKGLYEPVSVVGVYLDHHRTVDGLHRIYVWQGWKR